MNVELRYLHAFRTVCEAGSLRAAATRLHRTEQAIGYQLRRLEESMGMPLFERRDGRLKPNRVGQRLWTFCRGLQQDWLRLHDEIFTEGDATLRIAAVSGYGRYALLPLFRDGPLADLSIRMQYPTAEEVVRKVAAGECELGFVHHLPPHDHLLAVPADREEIVLIASAKQPPPVLDAAAFESTAFITYDESDHVFTRWFAAVLDRDTPSLPVAAHFEELEEVVDWVALGRGVSIMPLHCAAEHERSGAVRVVRAAHARCSNTIHAVMRAESRELPAVVRTLSALHARPGG